MQISDIAAALSALAVLAGGVTSLLVLRVQRDMANLKNEILDGINGKYISRREHEIIDRESDAWVADTEKKIEETRHQHHILHEEFIECRAKHGG